MKIYAATVEALKKKERQGEISAFNAQGSKLIVVAFQVGAVKIYAATMEALKKKERQGETRFTTKTEVHPPLNANVFFFLESYPIYDQTQGSSVVFLAL